MKQRNGHSKWETQQVIQRQVLKAEHSRKGLGSKCSLSFKVSGKENKKTTKVGAHGAVYISKPTPCPDPSLPSGMKT